MYRTVVFLVNLWMRLFPNYKEYFRYSNLASECEQLGDSISQDYTTRASTLSRGFLLPDEQRWIDFAYDTSKVFDGKARRCMRPITVEELKYKPDRNYR